MTKLEREWEKRLERMGLGLQAGTNAEHLEYGHDVRQLDFDGRRLWPQEAEQGEDWPVSLP